jgi:predicted transglutaminase-like cysteine proteinase
MTSELCPLGWTNFVLANPAQRGADGAAPPIAWTPELARQLGAINDKVNEGIVPSEADVNKPWRVWPPDGCCHDYAVTKRSALMQAGIPSSCLLLAEVQIPDAEYHLVLVVRTTRGPITLDNLTPALLDWPPPDYTMVEMQSAANPDLWED